MKNTTLFLVAAASALATCVPALGAASGAAVSDTNLGNVMYVGDSITHGVNSASYRWALHKIFADNGIRYDGVGYRTGNLSGGVATGTTYGGVSFSNAHSSQASARAYEIAGTQAGGRFDYTNIQNWLGQSTKKTNGQTYTGATYDVDSFFLLIGTNDLLSDSNTAGITDAKVTNLIANTKSILDSMFTSNSAASVTVLSIPCWTHHANSNAESYHTGVKNYNDQLKSTVESYKSSGKNANYVDVNKGIIDVANSTPFYGVKSMFNNPSSDGLHPNAQGDLLMAGNVAKSLGYAGRSAGQTRKAASEFSTHVANFSAGTGTLPSNISTINTTVTTDGKLSFANSGESSLVATWTGAEELSKGFTLELGGLVVGDGLTSGWDTKTNLSVAFGNGNITGTLNVNEAYIQWGDKILYSTDMSLNTENIRVSYIVGNALEGLNSGFYVWLDDMLIGEALTAGTGTQNGANIFYAGTGKVELGSFSMTAGSYAPTTTGILDANNAYVVSDSTKIIVAPAQGVVEFKADTNAVVTMSNNGYTFAYANQNAHSGDVWATMSSGAATGWSGAHTGGDLTGNAGFKITGDATGGGTVFGAVNAGTVSGNVYLDISAENAVFGSFTATTEGAASVIGTFKANVTGTFHAQISAGTFNAAVMGGVQIQNGDSYSVGKTEIYINGGTFNAGVLGGSQAGTIGSATSPALFAGMAEADYATRVVVTAGTIAGGVFGGGSGGTINGDTYVEVTGGTISGGIYGGGKKVGTATGDTINGNTNVVVNAACTIQLEKTSTISGGGTAGTITGNSSVTLSNWGKTNFAMGVDKFAGTISGGTNVAGTSTLTLDNVRLTNLAATIADFDKVILKNGTSVGLTSLGGASRLEMGAGTSLTLATNADLSALTSIVLGNNAALTLNFELLTAEQIVFTVAEGDTFSLLALGGSLDMDLCKVKFSIGDKLLEAIATIPDAQAGTVFVSYKGAIPEPSMFGLLAGLGALALAGTRRCRRK